MILNKEDLKKIVFDFNHPHQPEFSGIKNASVALLIPESSRDKIIGILKTSSKKYAWGNQVALPGGHVDDKDGSSLNAAIREVREELNLENISITGSLGHFMTIKNVCVEAFAGFYDEKEEIVPLEREIAKVLEMPIDTLMETHLEKNFHGRQPSIEELLYPIDDVIIWGLTARIIHHFLELAIEAENTGKSEERMKN